VTVSASAAKDHRDPSETKPSGKRVWIGRAVMIGTLVLMVYLLQRTLSQYSLDDLLSAVRAVPAERLLLAGAFAAASYAVLTGFDWLAVRYVGQKLAYWQTALTAFTSLSIGHSVGLSGLSSGAIRYRFYSRWGLSVGDVAKITLFNGCTVALGLMLLAGFAFLFDGGLASEITGLGGGAVLALGLGCLALVGLYLVLAAILRRPLRIRNFSMEMPTLRLALGQVVIGTVNFALVAACLHQALAAIAEVSYPGVAAVYVMANTATLITHVPGGLGVIESVVTFLVPGGQVIGAVLVFRAVYFLVPLVIGLVTLGLSELFQRRLKEAETPA
jgi:uncharacterized membrane protein YbhN (UPF0104 family)